MQVDPGLAVTRKGAEGVLSPGLPGRTLPGKGLSTGLVPIGEVGCSAELRGGCPSGGREEGKGRRVPWGWDLVDACRERSCLHGPTDTRGSAVCLRFFTHWVSVSQSVTAL